MKTTYATKGTCARFIEIEIDEEEVEKKVNFIGGCRGNTKGLSILLQGMPVQVVINRLRGISCRGNTSCPDQLAIALEQMTLKKAS